MNILQVHFEESQFEQYRKDGKRKLKPNAIPTLFDVTNPPKSVTNKRKSKRTKQTPLKTENAHNNNHSYVKTHYLEDKLDTTMDVNILESGTSVPDFNIETNKRKKLTILSRYQQQISNIKKQLATTKAKLRIMHMKHTTLQENLKKIFNTDQIEAITTVTKKVSRWSEPTIKKGFQIRFATGITGYNMMRNQGMPLPSNRTLSERLQHIKFKPGIQHDIVDALKDKITSLNSMEKKFF